MNFIKSIICLIVVLFAISCGSKKVIIEDFQSDYLTQINYTTTPPNDKSVVWVPELSDGIFFFNNYSSKWEQVQINTEPLRLNSGPTKINNPDLISDYIDISSLGVIPNSKNNTTEIRKAISIASNSGKGLYFPSGTYNLSSSILKCSIIGESNTILKLLPSSNSNVFIVESRDSILIKNITFDGNKKYQLAPPLIENFSGLGKLSLVQVKSGFDNLTFDNCKFQNSIQGAIALMEDYPIISQGNMNIISCVFQDLRTEAIRYYRSSKILSVHRKNRFIGELQVTGSKFLNIGTKLSSKDKRGLSNYGNAIGAGNLFNVTVTDCFFENTARFDVKIGFADNVNINNNFSVNASWGHVQTQTSPFGLDYASSGFVTVSDITFVNNLPDESSKVVQLKGSLIDEPNHSVFNSVTIKDCNIFYLNQSNKILGDCFQVTSEGKYKSLLIENNFCYGIRRGFVGISLPRLDNFEIDSVVIQYNEIIGRGKTGTTANSLIYTQVTKLGGKPISDLLVKNNQVSEVQSSIFLEGDPVKNLIVQDNVFNDLYRYSIFFVDGNERLLSKEFNRNEMTGKVFEKKINKK